MALRILIIGAGHVGAALGLGWLAVGHDVLFAVKDPASGKYDSLPRDRLVEANAPHGADIVVLATPYAAAVPALEVIGGARGLTVIDCTNPLGMGPDGLHLTLGFDTSGAEAIAAAFPEAHLFKTLNQTGAENMAEARAYHPTPVMFVAGDAADRKPQVMGLVTDLGFHAVDAGPLSAARLLEPLAMLWIELALKRGQARDFAFSMVRHPRRPIEP
jgi:predicted dinucleotide-binding enzyme